MVMAGVGRAAMCVIVIRLCHQKLSRAT
jgi:hypothetical protein